MTFDIEYQGLDTETLILVSDDDSFLFINNKLAINNGTLHGSLGSSVRLKLQADALGLEVGKTYPVHVFMAERNIAGIINIVGRNVKFVNCGARLPKISD